MSERDATPEEKAKALEAFARAVDHVGRGGALHVVEPSPADHVIHVHLDAADVLALMDRLAEDARRPAPHPPPPQLPLPRSTREPAPRRTSVGAHRLLGAVCAACMAVVFVQRALGHELSPGQYLAVVALLFTVGVAGRQGWL